MVESVTLRRKQPKQTPPLVPVVGIGASAGGLDAFRALLKALPDDTGMAFVLIAHLMPEKKSVLGELLARETSMPVNQLEADTPVEANHVYVIPPDQALTIQNGHLEIRKPEASERPSMVIDTFFRSLAEARRAKAVGVILSGTGSDGSSGLADIKGEGGITFIQDSASAAFAEMPNNARAAADYVLSPEEIAAELKRIARHPYVMKEPALPLTGALPRDGEVREIFKLLEAKCGVDFSRYKSASIHRRIARRMLLRKMDSLRDYLKYLRTDKYELDALYQDLLITVTEFFRDPGAFDVLKKAIIPEILRNLGNDAARVWVPGCASGEEAYSIAICFVEAATERAGTPVQVFATDVNVPCINKARRAVYPETIAASVSPERLQRFFVKTHDGYQVNKFVRDLCIFAEQNVLADAPFSRMDLVSCRNLLIYLDNAAQREVLQRFHYALKTGGFLFLGTSESVSAAPQLFEEVQKPQRIYSKLPASRVTDFALTTVNPAHRPVAATRASEGAQPIEISRDVDHILLSRFAPAGVVLNSAMDILEFRGSTASFIHPVPGEATLNIFRMIREEMAIPLRLALDESKTANRPVRKEVEIHFDQTAKKLTLEVVRLRPDTRGHPYYLVLFGEAFAEPARTYQTRKAKMPKDATSRRISKLEAELRSADQRVRSIVEERDSTNQELQSANEEILANNEELQSMNEEMQTAKEELQAANEELHSVNDELQRRNIDAGAAYSELNDIILSLDSIHLVVDNQSRIRRFTPAAQKLFNLTPGDLGRPIADINPNLSVSDLPEMIRSVIANLAPVERQVQDGGGRWYLLRIRPYKTESMKIDGAVLSLMDIDNVKRAG